MIPNFHDFQKFISRNQDGLLFNDFSEAPAANKPGLFMLLVVAMMMMMVVVVAMMMIMMMMMMMMMIKSQRYE
jgi:hypothetical protein